MPKIFTLILGLLVSNVLYAFEFDQLARHHIVPAYQTLSERTFLLKREANRYCDAPTEERFITLKQAYTDAFISWQSAQHLRFGPVQYLSREHRYQLWPDKRGTVGKHLRTLMSSGELHNPDFDIRTKSVALQGFSALERVLFGDKQASKEQCILMSAIGGNLQEMSSGLLSNWVDGENAYLLYFTRPTGTEDNLYESDQELANLLLNSLYTQLEVMVTQKLDKPLGISIEKARSKRAEAWRSQNTGAALRANLKAAQAFYLTAFSTQLPEPTHQKIQLHFSTANQQLNTIAAGLPAAVERPEDRASVLELRQQLSALKRVVATELAQTLDLSLGFNSLDGD